MPSVFKPCRECGEPVFVGAKRCPNCRAAISRRFRLRKNLFPLLILALAGLGTLGVLIFGWPNQTAPNAATKSEEDSPPQLSVPPTAPTPAVADRSPLRAPGPADAAPKTATTRGEQSGEQSIAALQQRRDTEPAQSLNVRGKRIEPGMSADSLFEVVSRQDLIGQTMAPDTYNAPNLQFVKYYRVDGKEFAVELRKATPKAPYRVTWVRVLRPAERAQPSR